MTSIAITFALQVAVQIRTGASSPSAAVHYGFSRVPELMWLFALFFHVGPVHLLTNAALLLALAPTEEHLSRGRYALLFAASGGLSIVGGALYLYVVSPAVHVVYYGISGFGFGLAGFALVYHAVALRERELVDTIGAVIGVLAGLSVAHTVVAGAVNPLELNMGHVVGYAVGVVFALATAVAAD